MTGRDPFQGFERDLDYWKASGEAVSVSNESHQELNVDPDSVEPSIDWSGTAAVDIYQRPTYESNESRKQATVEFFKRLGLA